MPHNLRRLLQGGLVLVGSILLAIALHSYLTRPVPPPVDPSVLATEQPVMPVPTVTASQEARPTKPTPTHKVSSFPSSPSGCSTVSHAFIPQSVTIRGVTTNATVLAEDRDANGTPQTPPLTDTGKQQFAWDAPGAKPGATNGNVLLNAHTWPDGSALGNRLLKQLQSGDVIVVKAATGEQMCYRVTERLEVTVADYPQGRVYDVDGPPQVIITVCSGLRLGPGDWANRTLWFATPMK